MSRRGVLVNEGVVQNVIAWGDESQTQYENEGWEHVEETTDVLEQPGIGWTWTEADGFRPPKPYESWVWKDGAWTAPKALPKTGGPYQWDEETLSWVTIPAEPTE